MISQGRLDIFQYFNVNTNLPKYKRTEPNVDEIEEVSDVPMSPNEGWDQVPSSGGRLWFNENSIAVSGSSTNSSVEPVIHTLHYHTRKKMLKYLAKQFVKTIFNKHQKPVISIPVNPMSIKEFFSNVKAGTTNLQHTRGIAEIYEQKITNAIKLNQTALVEILYANLDVIRAEAILLSEGHTKYITEDYMIEFFKKIEGDDNIKNRQLKLSWIHNFIRPIPTDIIQLKEDIDQLKVFDNYVILHFDPQDKATELTKKEKEARKDPILFGVLRNSTKLYFIADWKDEYCDLTLEDMVNTMGKDVFEINNDTIEKHMHLKQK